MKLCLRTKECRPHFYKADTSRTIISILGPTAVLVEGEVGVWVGGDTVWLWLFSASQTLIPAGKQQLGGLSHGGIWFQQQRGVQTSRRQTDRQRGMERRREGESTFGVIFSQHSVLFSLDKETKLQVASWFTKSCSANSPRFCSKSIFFFFLSHSQWAKVAHHQQ